MRRSTCPAAHTHRKHSWQYKHSRQHTHSGRQHLRLMRMDYAVVAVAQLVSQREGQSSASISTLFSARKTSRVMGSTSSVQSMLLLWGVVVVWGVGLCLARDQIGFRSSRVPYKTKSLNSPLQTQAESARHHFALGPEDTDYHRTSSSVCVLLGDRSGRGCCVGLVPCVWREFLVLDCRWCSRTSFLSFRLHRGVRPRHVGMWVGRGAGEVIMPQKSTQSTPTSHTLINVHVPSAL